MGNDFDTVVALTDIKEAALYFDFVIPDFSYLIGSPVYDALHRGVNNNDWISGVTEALQSESLKVPHAVVPPDLRDDKAFHALAMVVPLWLVIEEFTRDVIESPDYSVTPEALVPVIELVNSTLGVDLYNDEALQDVMRDLFGMYQIDRFPMIMPESWRTLYAPLYEDDPTPDESVCLSLIGSNLVDASNASWDQIVEFRKDQTSQTKLMKLRRLFAMQYEGKSPAFVQDDIAKSLEEHDAAARKFGFNLRMATLEAIFTSKWIQGAAAGSGIAALLGHPIKAIVAGTVGLAMEIGNSYVKLERQKFEFNEQVMRHPFGYIIEAREKLKVPS